MSVLRDHIEITEGWTKQIPIQLLTDGEPLNLTDLTLDVVIHDKLGMVVAFSGAVEVLVEATGEIGLKPTAPDFTAIKSPYRLHFQLTDLSSDVCFVPSGAGMKIVVHPK